MFEFSVASKYLLPRRRQLSVSIISLISVLVISLVVWLIVVFFSVTEGLEKNWIHKLTALTAPVRITPTEAYYHSYYYQIDSMSDQSGYGYKTIREKKESSLSDPYDPTYDAEIPSYWPDADRDDKGSLKDLVKLAYSSIDEIKGVPGIQTQDFELTITNIRLNLLRDLYSLSASNGSALSHLTYPAYLGNFESGNDKLKDTLIPLRTSDFNNLFNLIGVVSDPHKEDLTGNKEFFSPPIFQRRVKEFLQTVTITKLKTSSSGWMIPRSLLPIEATWNVCAIFKGDKVIRVIVPLQSKEVEGLQASLEEQNVTSQSGLLHLTPQGLNLEFPGQTLQPLPAYTPIRLAGNTEFDVNLISESLDTAKKIEEIQFESHLSIQGMALSGPIFYKNLEIGSAVINPKGQSRFPLWIHQDPLTAQLILPKDPDIGEGVILPKSFKDAGVLIGDRGYLTYLTPTASVLLEQRLPIYVSGFYDPGIIPIGGKFILSNPEATSLIRAAHNQEEKGMTNGINIRFSQMDQVDHVKAQLLKAFKEKGISRYWTVETYREYEFTKEIMHELQSQKTLFTLIAIVIIIVACSNIISMLIILVNDKRLEIGILRSMGASSKSIALIFGLAGGVIGITGSVIGITAAILTLNHLQLLVSLIGRMQGQQLFSSSLYGEVLPHELSYGALLFVLGATSCISLLAGIVPAVKACLLRPSSVLRSTGD